MVLQFEKDDAETTQAPVETPKETKPTPSSKRDFILNDSVTNLSVKDIMMGILEINRQDAEKEEKDADYVRKPITLVVNTYGGSVYDGFGLVAVIDASETPVHTYLYGKAMSMGLIIFASGHRRFAHPLGTLMYHGVSTGVQGKIQDIEMSITQTKRLNEAYDNYLLAVSDIPKEVIDHVKHERTELYLFALEAIEYGLVDEILPSRRMRG